MNRNQNPFTARQLALIKAVREKIREITDPGPDVIRHDSFEFYTRNTKRFGTILKIRFKPNSSQIKAELAESSGLLDDKRRERLEEIRAKHGLKKARNTDAMLFESEWDNIMFKFKKSVFVSGYINQMFASDNEALSKPTELMQKVVLETYSPFLKAQKSPENPQEAPATAETLKSSGYRGYDKILTEDE
jgi:hypothetical protein